MAEVYCGSEPCPLFLNSTCVFYTGESLLYIGVQNNDTLETIIVKINQAFQNAGVGYAFTNGLIQPTPFQPVQLGGALIQNTTIGGNFTLTFTGNVQAARHITTGGSSSQFVKGDGTLDSTAYQPAANYITGLSGDATASGPGVAAMTLATVNFSSGTFGNGNTIPIVTVNAKGLVTNITPVPVTIPPLPLTFIGDVVGSGFTGSNISLLLQNVNPNPYNTITPLKFTVNGKGLVTSASPITASDIVNILGYYPGTSGTSGTDGTSGTSGTTGTSGTSGTSGSAGTSGTTGTSGTSGTDGSGGTSGTSGTSATAGTSGSSGTSGTTGTSGTSATSGTSGTSGTDGTGGTSGTSGTSATAGTSGTSGSTGTSGTSGTTGTSGSSGTSGSTGTSGSSGTTGTSGSSGTTGTSGSSGTSGTTGTSGSSGTSGTTGTSGTSGLSGDRFKTTSTTTYTLQAPGNPGTLTVDPGLAYTVGQSIIIAYDANNHNEAEVTSYDAITGVINFVTFTLTGSGTYSSWFVNIDGASGGDGSSGSSGTSGTSATAGTSGTTGTSGSSGTSGTTGTSGSSGTSGTSATDGTGGTSGTSGSSGTSGTTGTSGTSATSGTSGTSATSGTTGTSGTSGVSGTGGSSGTSGTSGATQAFSNVLTMNNSGSGDSSGTTYNGSAPRTISYNTIGAPSTTGANASGTWPISISGNAATVSSVALLGNNISYNNDRTTKIGNGLAIYTAYSSGANSPWTYDLAAQFVTASSAFELSASWHTPSASLKLRTLRDCCENWSSWVDILTSSNYNSYSPTLGGVGATGTWAINITGSAGSAGSVDFNNLTNKSGGTGTYQTSGDFRAPIFYDSNNTGYYLDAASSGTSLNINGGISTTAASGSILLRHPVSEANAWLFMENSPNWGLFWFNNNTQSGQTIGSYTTIGAELFGTNNAVAGFNPNSAWAGTDANTRATWMLSNYTGYIWSNSTIFAAGDMRAPIFYDSNDTGYFGNFAGISSLWGLAIRGDNASINTENQIFFWGAGNTTTSAIGFKANGGSFTNPTGSGDGYNTYLTMDYAGRGWVFREGVGGTNFGAAYTSGWILNNGIWQANASMRAPIFYDSNDTGFYADFNSTGASINIAGSLNAATYNKPAIIVNSSGTTSAGSAIGMQQATGEGWTGIFVDFEPNTGWGFYHDNPNNYFLFTSEISTGAIGGGFTVPSRVSGNRTAYTKFLINQVTGDVTVGRVATAQQDMRSPIFYDSNNTAYYVDPESGSVLGGKLRMQSDSGGYGQFQINSSTTGIEATIVFGSGGSGQNSGQYTFAGVIGLGAYGLPKSNFYFGAGYSGPAMYIPNSGAFAAAVNSFRAPIFYDSDDTTYYLDPNTSGVSLNIRGGISSVRSDTESILRSYNASAGSPLQFYLDHSFGNVNIGNNRGIVYAGGSYWEFANSARAPIFYDVNNTAFYLDPAFSSNLDQVFASQLLSYNAVTAQGSGWNTYLISLPFGGYLRCNGHIVIDQSATGYNVYVLDGNSVGVVKFAGNQFWSAHSDARIKTVHSTLENNLSKLDGINPVYYSFNNFDDDKNRIGLIAQEVQEHFPELVNLDPKNDSLALDYTGLIPVLLGAIKELKTELETLKTRI